MEKFIKILDLDNENEKMTLIFEKDKRSKEILKNPSSYSKDEINNAMMDSEIITSLRAVIDPELGINIFDLGLIYDFNVINRTLKIEYTLTTMGCPLGNYIEMSILENVNRNGEFDEVLLNLTFSPQWNIKHLPYETKLLLDML
jgi:metal-sulfur cluster biosynthetic enzyme